MGAQATLGPFLAVSGPVGRLREHWAMEGEAIDVHASHGP
jgi:hypothetical protein